MSKLLRHFALVVTVAIAAVAVALVALYRTKALSDLAAQAEAQNTALARTLVNGLWPRLGGALAPISERGGRALRLRPESEEIRAAIAGLVANVPVLQVDVAASDGILVFSTDPTAMGETRAADMGFIGAFRRSEAVSRVEHRQAINALAGRLFDRDVVVTHLPVAEEGSPAAVVVLTSDLTLLTAGVARTTTELAIGVTLALGALYGILIAMMRRTCRIMEDRVVAATAGSEYPALDPPDLAREAAQRHRIEEELRRKLVDLDIVAAILRIAMKPVAIDEILHKTLNIVLTNHGLGLESQGCIFLVDPKVHELVLRAHRNLAKPLLKSCARLPFGRCLCGRAAETGVIVHADGLDFRHDITFPGIHPHGHYCVPILHEGEVLGVMTFYIPEGHKRDADEERLLLAVADTLAGVIRRKQAEALLLQSEQRFRDFAEAASDWFWEMGPDLRFTLFSDRFYGLFGLRPEDVLGHTRLDRANPEELEGDPEKWRRHMDDLASRRSFRDFEFATRDGAGRLRHLRISGRPVFDTEGAFAGYRGTGTDATEITHARAQLEEANRELERRVEERTRALTHEIAGRIKVEADLRTSKTLAEAASRAKSEFLANVSHELRTPLNAIIGFSEAMRERLFGSLGDSHYDGYVENIHGSGEHLLEIINDILDFVATDTCRLTLRDDAVDVEGLIDAASARIRPRAESARQHLAITAEPHLPRLRGDLIRLKKILFHLLANAAKFTPEGGRIEITAGLEEGGGLRIAVADSGIGMSEEDQVKALTLFGQADTTLARRYEGLGIGLPLANSLMEAHGSKLAISSRSGEGTTVTLHFPAERLLR